MFGDVPVVSDGKALESPDIIEAHGEPHRVGDRFYARLGLTLMCHPLN